MQVEEEVEEVEEVVEVEVEKVVNKPRPRTPRGVCVCIPMDGSCARGRGRLSYLFACCNPMVGFGHDDPTPLAAHHPPATTRSHTRVPTVTGG